MQHDHWNTKTFKFVEAHLQTASQHIRISTGFFSIQGYDLIRPYLIGKSVKIIVGYDEISKQQLQATLIQEIMLYLSRWEAANRREAVISLVQQIKNKQFSIAEQTEGGTGDLDARSRSRDHAKIFVIDDTTALVGSNNLSWSGLKRNVEGVSTVIEKERVAYYLERFERYWNAKDTYDLTKALLEALEKWLALAPPFYIYLKTLLALSPEDDTEAPRVAYKMPVNYQRVVIERVLRQLKTYRGAMLVASTGLGKTIMATHTALRLKLERRIDNVVVFAPVAVHKNWKTDLKNAGISNEVITINLLDNPINSKSTGKGMIAMEEALRYADKKHLIIIDESQHFRNKVKIGNKRKAAFHRLTNLIADKEPYIILLTATPYTKGVKDLNNQLYLLPHNAPKLQDTENGQLVFDAFASKISPWCVSEVSPSIFNEFIKLPVTTVISTSQVAKIFATSTDAGEYIDFNGFKRWLPQIEIQRANVPLPLEQEISELIYKGVFEHIKISMPTRDGWTTTNSSITKEAELAWMSSPSALIEVLERTIGDKYPKIKFKRSQEEREEYLSPILAKLKSLSYQKDEKFQTLWRIVKTYTEQNERILIFTERLATAVYLEDGLAQFLSNFKVACTIKKAKDKYTQKSQNELNKLIYGFAPEANKDKITSSKLEQYQVLIATDAHGAGINLQDASVAINYDLAWTPDVLIQRAGRILRFWKQARKVTLISFVGDFKHDVKGIGKTKAVNRRFEKLTIRAEQAKQFSGNFDIIPTKSDSEQISLAKMADDNIDYLGLADISQLEEFTGISPMLQHHARLKEHEDLAQSLADDLSSAMTYEGKHAKVYLLLRYQNEPQIVLYNLSNNRFEKIEEDELLQLLECDDSTPVAPIAADEIEQATQQVRRYWMKQHNIKKEELVERICALYLVPKRSDKQII